MDPSTLSSLYLKEKAMEEEFPGIGFRDAVSGREAFVLGHRVAAWEVLEVFRQVGSISRTAAYFRWPEALVRCAFAFAEAYPDEIRAQHEAETARP